MWNLNTIFAELIHTTMKKLLLIATALLICAGVYAQTTYKTIENVSYLLEKSNDSYKNERCKLDLYYPENVENFPTVVWFHGGGLTAGSKALLNEFKNKGIAIAAVNYRLSPKATHPAYIEDVAEAIAWVFKTIGKYGGSDKQIYVVGHSAGAYLSLMVALDKRYLAKHGIDSDSVAAYFPISGQGVTHNTIRREKGLSTTIPIIDEYAALYHVRPDTPPIILFTGDRNTELANRWEENVLLESVLRNVGNKGVKLFELQGFNHDTVWPPACIYAANYIRQMARRANAK